MGSIHSSLTLRNPRVRNASAISFELGSILHALRKSSTAVTRSWISSSYRVASSRRAFGVSWAQAFLADRSQSSQVSRALPGLLQLVSINRRQCLDLTQSAGLRGRDGRQVPRCR